MTPMSPRAASSAVLAAFLLVGVSGCGSAAPRASQSPEPTYKTFAPYTDPGNIEPYTDPAESWVPSDYTVIGNGDVAMKFNDFGFDGVFSNDSAEVVTRDGCASLYIEVNLFDSSDTILGYTNAVVNNIGAGEKAKVTFEWSEDGVTRIETEKVDCL